VLAPGMAGITRFSLEVAQRWWVELVVRVRFVGHSLVPWQQFDKTAVR